MKRLFALLLTLGMLIPGFMSVSAQTDGAPLAVGIGQPATAYGDDGAPMATLTVNEIEAGWSDHDEYSAPEAGTQFTAIHFTVDNIGAANIIVNPYDFSVIDADSRAVARSYVRSADGVEPAVTTDDVPVSAGEAVDLVIVFQIDEAAEPAFFMWQPASGKLALVNVGALTQGIGTVATANDAQGEPLASYEVVSIEQGWTDHSEVVAPQDGYEFVAVTVRVTNLTASPMILKPFRFSVIDSQGTNMGQTYVTMPEGVATIKEDVPVDAGASYEGTMIFQVPVGESPLMMTWQPDTGVMVLIGVGEPDAAVPGTPEATPAT